MLSDNIILQSIACYHKQIAEKASKILGLYEFGLHDKGTRLREIQVLTGYRKTLQRYLDNKSTLTQEQAMCLLLVCEDDSDVFEPIVFIPSVPFLYVIFPPAVAINVPEEITSYIIEVGIPAITLEHSLVLTHIPRPSVVITLPTGEEVIELIHVPLPIVLFGPKDKEVTLLSIPTPGVSFDTEEVDMPQAPPELAHVPYPGVDFSEESTSPGEDDELSSLEEVPLPSVSFEVSAYEGEVYFFGVIPNTGTRPEAESVNFLSLNKVILSSDLPDDLHILFPNEKGWAVFAIPDSSLMRQSYYISDQNKGVIGGSPTGPSANLWPEHEVVVYDTRPYKLYITSYVTRIDRAVTVRAAIYNPRYQSGVLPIE